MGATNDTKGATGAGGKQMTCAQRIEAATTTKAQVNITENQMWDAEALFRKYDTDRTQLLTRGALTDLLKEIGLDKKLGDSFPASSRLAFDAHSADHHFLALPEFKQLYHHISTWHPTLLPRAPTLSITLMGARDLPPSDTNGKADPFCTVVCCKTDASGKIVSEKKWSKATTKVVEKTLNPWWGEDHHDKYGYDEGDSLLFQVYDWDKGDKSELMCRAILPASEFHRPGGFNATVPLEVLLSDAPRGLKPVLKTKVCVRGMPEPEPRLRVTIHSAVGLPPADSNGKSDPFCSFQIVGKPFSKSVTKIINKSLEPVWNENFTGKFRYEDGDDLFFEVRDYDGKNAKPELLGRCALPNAEFAKMGGFHGDVPMFDVARGCIPSSDTQGYKPTLKLTAFLTDMMPPFSGEAAPEASAAAPSAGCGGPAGGPAEGVVAGASSAGSVLGAAETLGEAAAAGSSAAGATAAPGSAEGAPAAGTAVA